MYIYIYKHFPSPATLAASQSVESGFTSGPVAQMDAGGPECKIIFQPHITRPPLCHFNDIISLSLHG